MKTFSTHHSFNWEDSNQPKKKARFSITAPRDRSDTSDSITDLKSSALIFFYGTVLLATVSYFYYLNSTSIHEMIFGKKKPQTTEVVETY